MRHGATGGSPGLGQWLVSVGMSVSSESLSGSDRFASDQLVADVVEGMEARRTRGALEPVGGGEDPGRVRRAVACGQAKLDRLAGRIEPDQVHPRRLARPDRDDLEVVGDPQSRMARNDAAREVGGRARRPITLGPAVPFEQVRVEYIERAE